MVLAIKVWTSVCTIPTPRSCCSGVSPGIPGAIFTKTLLLLLLFYLLINLFIYLFIYCHCGCVTCRLKRFYIPVARAFHFSAYSRQNLSWAGIIFCTLLLRLGYVLYVD